MGRGVPILGTVTKKCKVVQEGAFTFRIILTQGLNRQIRRMCEHFGYEVTKLERVRIMNIDLKGLPTGDWRDLTKDEMEVIFGMIEGSTSEPSLPKAKAKSPAKHKPSRNREGGYSPTSVSGAKRTGSKRPGSPKASGKREGKSRVSPKSEGRRGSGGRAAGASGRGKKR
jgi:23S rRNA pseudouridine2604 synthase